MTATTEYNGHQYADCPGDGARLARYEDKLNAALEELKRESKKIEAAASLLTLADLGRAVSGVSPSAAATARIWAALGLGDLVPADDSFGDLKEYARGWDACRKAFRKALELEP